MPVVVVAVDVHVSPSTHHALHDIGISVRGKGVSDIGSWSWVAPEINPFLGKPANGERNEKTDVWAFGLVRYASDFSVPVDGHTVQTLTLPCR
jgi:hypothetical protein